MKAAFTCALYTLKGAFTFAVLAFGLLIPRQALSNDLALGMQRFSQQDGIDNSYIYNMAQDNQGYIYVYTMKGFYFYSGKRFYRFDSSNFSDHLSHHVVMRPMPDGRLLLLQRDELTIATLPTSARLSPQALSFRPVHLEHIGRIKDIFFQGEQIFGQDENGLRKCRFTQASSFSCENNIVPHSANARIYQLGGEPVIAEAGSTALRNVSGSIVYAVPNSTLSSNFDRGRVEGNLYFLRDSTLVSPNSDGVFSEALIDWPLDLKRLQKRPAFAVGAAETKAFFDGEWLRSFDGKYWSFLNHDFSREQEIFFAFVDKDKQLWTEQDSVELDKFVGWGQVENLEPQNILSVWSVLPVGRSQVLFTGQGLYSLYRHELSEKLRSGDFFFGESDGDAGFWSPADDSALLHCSLVKSSAHCDKSLPVRRVTGLAFSPQDRVLWVASDDGLLRLSTKSSKELKPVRGIDGQELRAQANAVALRGEKTPWVIIGNALYHENSDGRFVPVIKHWPNGRQFTPLTMIFTSHDDLWIGGIRARNGLLHLHLDADRVVKIEQIDPSLVGSQLVFSLLADTGHRLWAGTENGVTGFDGNHWIRIGKEDGLISTNINQQGLTGDRDGSIWISTLRGVSHLLHPERLFQKQDLRPVFVKVMLGDRLLPEKAVPYSRDPLMVTLGTLNTALATTTYFRYRLEGTDEDWITTTTGEIRYNFVQPGHSRLVVQALNDNRNIVSDPIVLEIRMQRPWWATWPLILGYTVSVIALPYSLNKLRYRYLLKRQKRLEALVDERTQEMRAAQSALELQARQDGLTKLMNRRTAEASVSRLLEKLARADYDGGPRSATMALFDVDHFKSINDTFGHGIGDEILAGIGERLLRTKRPEEIIGRHGGEEFLIVVQGEFAEARDRIARLLAALSDVPFETKVGALSIGCSAGIARTSPEEIWADTLERADQALYKAKIEGRGRIVVSVQDRDDEDYPG